MVNSSINSKSANINKIDICNDEYFFKKIKEVNDDHDIWEMKKIQLYYIAEGSDRRKIIIGFIKKILNENNIIVYIFK